MPINLQCPHRKRHAILYPEEGVIEIKCDRGNCGAGKGVVVLHRWDSNTGEPMETLRFAEPNPRKEQRYATG